jgi:hypothetical protein
MIEHGDGAVIRCSEYQIAKVFGTSKADFPCSGRGALFVQAAANLAVRLSSVQPQAD